MRYRQNAPQAPPARPDGAAAQTEVEPLIRTHV